VPGPATRARGQRPLRSTVTREGQRPNLGLQRQQQATGRRPNLGQYLASHCSTAAPCQAGGGKMRAAGSGQRPAAAVTPPPPRLLSRTPSLVLLCHTSYTGRAFFALDLTTCQNSTTAPTPRGTPRGTHRPSMRLICPSLSAWSSQVRCPRCDVGVQCQETRGNSSGVVTTVEYIFCCWTDITYPPIILLLLLLLLLLVLIPASLYTL
jgi:hypothetical protein